MTEKFDLIIRGGTILDGTGSPEFQADIGIRNGLIAAIGDLRHDADEIVDAEGLLVTPGFVDIHTHYDGHVTWANHLEPSASHGVTTVVTGNCGVGFAPCKPEDRERLIRLMEGVEDIPSPVLATGLPWTWESFPDFLDFLQDRTFDVDVAVQLPHAPLRVYAMGERGAAGEAANAEDIAVMRRLAEEAVKAGALGFTTSRSLNHRASDGTPTPSLKATEAELTGIALGLKDAGTGVLQLISDFKEAEAEFEMLKRIAASSGRPMSFTLLQLPGAPQLWRQILSWIADANADGLNMKAQVCGRPVGALAGLHLSFNPFSFCPSYADLAHLPLPDRVAALRQPERRAAILAEFPGRSDLPIAAVVSNLDNCFLLGDPLNYEPDPSDSIAAQARRRGSTAAALAYDLLAEGDGETILYIPALNYADGTMAAAEVMLQDPHAILGLGDGGAHCGIICDASFTTYMLTRWSSLLTMPRVIKALTADTARAVGLNDRGVLAPGYRADLNIIDTGSLRLHKPEMVVDLPEQGSRLHQKADGYMATIVGGTITRQNGLPTGALPGRLIRGARPAPENPRVPEYS